jgi:hypothetical protein
MPGRERKLQRAPRTVVGYHGCSRETAERILAGEPLIPSTRSYDWLGIGVYFWEYGPYRAREWARQKFGRDAAVIEATIRLRKCLNLLDSEHLDGLQTAYENLRDQAALTGFRLPVNLDDGRYYLDREIIESYCRLQLEQGRSAFQTIRGCYPEGLPVFPGSKILSLAHVQVAVRDASCLVRLRLVT